MRCHHCQTLIKLHGGNTSNFSGHVTAKHEVVVKMAVRNSATTVSAPSSSTSEIRQLGHKQLYFVPDVDGFRQLLVRWWREDHVAFAMVDTIGSQELMLAVNPLIRPYLCSRVTLARWTGRDDLPGQGGSEVATEAGVVEATY